MDVTGQILDTVRRFVDREVIPVASKYEHADEYPTPLVERMKELGLFGATIPAEHGGLGLDYSTYAQVVEELCRGWMSLSGVLNTHLLFADQLVHHGTAEQRQRYLPTMARGEHRAGFCLTEPHAGSDTQNIRTTAIRRGDHYVVNGSKMFITNAQTATVFSLVAKTDPTANPPHKGISLFAAEKGPGLTVSRHLDK
ncbi:MAG TPA: acyl-CoA dehydrogenase family protein, partial [Dongiaceae bacterium]|nr:acyl-CoA dehydrogenase family protein [Dongiaceae bacterium]